jgi:class 3 adenylate cyclase
MRRVPAIAANPREGSRLLWFWVKVVIVTASASTVVDRELIISLLIRYRLPNVYYARYYSANGGLASYGPDSIENFARAAGVMFCDLVDSTGVAARLDAEEWRDLVGAYLDAGSSAVMGWAAMWLKAR